MKGSAADPIDTRLYEAFAAAMDVLQRFHAGALTTAEQTDLIGRIRGMPWYSGAHMHAAIKEVLLRDALMRWAPLHHALHEALQTIADDSFMVPVRTPKDPA
ncbi:MAG TPA: hypothetical protein VFG73_02460 [Rhodanobacteraceae bacterium]|nr:hypothetical protein [Rhodanobacteraceae bacterium]